MLSDARTEVEEKIAAATKAQNEKATKTLNEEKAKIEREINAVTAELESERMSKEEMEKTAKSMADLMIKKIIPAEVGA